MNSVSGLRSTSTDSQPTSASLDTNSASGTTAWIRSPHRPWASSEIWTRVTPGKLRRGAGWGRRTRVRRRPDRRARERPAVEVLHHRAPDDLPVVADPHDVVLVSQREDEIGDGAAVGFHVVRERPGLHVTAVAVDAHVLVDHVVHR